MEAFAFYDTAGSVKQLVELRDRHAAAIASEAAASYYGAQILLAGIEDNPENFTRFFLVRRTADAVTDPESNKISIAFSVENRPGSLVSALAEFSALGTNLTKIESRPVHGKPWEYIFYVDCQIQSPEEGASARKGAQPALQHGEGLGCYREAQLPGAKLPSNRGDFFECCKKGWAVARPFSVRSTYQTRSDRPRRWSDCRCCTTCWSLNWVSPKVGTLMTMPRNSARMSKLGLIS